MHWRNVGIVMDDQPIHVDGLNPWQHEWQTTDQPDIELPHPSYPNQLHRMTVYQIANGTKMVVFAAGELSPNVWGFFVPDGTQRGN